MEWDKSWTAAMCVANDLVRTNKRVMAPEEETLVEKWAVELKLYDRWQAAGSPTGYGVLTQRLLKSRDAKPPEGRPATLDPVEKRKPRVRGVSLTDMECEILTKAVGELLLSNRVHISHCRLLLEKLERAKAIPNAV